MFHSISTHIFAKKLGSSSIYFWIDNISCSLYLSNSKFLTTLNFNIFPGLIYLGKSIRGTSSILCSADNNIALPSSILPTVQLISNFFFLLVGIYYFILSFALILLSKSDSSTSSSPSSSPSEDPSSFLSLLLTLFWLLFWLGLFSLS